MELEATLIEQHLAVDHADIEDGLASFVTFSTSCNEVRLLPLEIVLPYMKRLKLRQHASLQDVK